MSNSIEDLYDFGSIKKCRLCKAMSLKSNFHKN